MDNLWVREILKRIKRREIQIWFAEEHLKEKSLTVEDLEFGEITVRIGKIDYGKSDENKKRICFKNYFKKKGKTYFVVVEGYPNMFKIITINAKKGKY